MPCFMISLAQILLLHIGTGFLLPLPNKEPSIITDSFYHLIKTRYSVCIVVREAGIHSRPIYYCRSLTFSLRQHINSRHRLLNSI